MYSSGYTLNPENPDLSPMLVIARFSSRDFFTMFDVPFLYGGPWDASVDENPEMVAIIDRETNDEVFGGENSVGRTLELDTMRFTVIGVIDDWQPTPNFYTVVNGRFSETEDVYLPFSLTEPYEIQHFGNTMCWGDDVIDSRQAFLQSECTWVEYWVELTETNQIERYKSWLAGYVAEQKQAGRFPREKAMGKIHNVMQWMDYNNVVSSDFQVLVGLAFMFLAVCLLNTVALLVAKFSGMAPLVSLRRALGASKAMIFRQHLVEVGIIGFGGGALGLGLAWLGLQGVKAINVDSSYDRLASLDVNLIVFAVSVSLLATLIAGIYPTWRICQISPSVYLKTQ
jgi:putative ABC transport system permease protein